MARMVRLGGPRLRRLAAALALARAVLRPVHADALVDADGVTPAIVRAHGAILQRVEFARAGLDAHLLGQIAPAYPGIALVALHHVQAGNPERTRDGAGEVHVGRRPAPPIQQIQHQRARRAVVARHLRHERVAVAAAVIVDFAQTRIHPDIARADVVTHGLCLYRHRRCDRPAQRRDHDGGSQCFHVLPPRTCGRSLRRPA